MALTVDGSTTHGDTVMNAAERARIQKNRAMGHHAMMDREMADAGHSAQYRESLDHLSQARLREGVGMANRQMAAQAVSRGSSPLAQRMAIMQGGANALQATNASAQFAQQADMAGAQMAQGAQQMRLNALMQQEAFNQQERDRYAQLAIAKMQQPGGPSAGETAGNVLGGLGSAAAGAAMIFSDVANKQGIIPMSGGGGSADIAGMSQGDPGAYMRYGQGINGLLTGAGQMFTSDRRSKSLIMALADENNAMRQAMAEASPRGEMGGPSERNELDNAMRAMPAYAYSYKPEAAAAMGQPAAPRAGIMAQDAERHPLTAAMVRETPQGKAIDMPTAMSTNMAMTSRLAERLDRLEQQDDPNRFVGPPDLDAQMRDAGRQAAADMRRREDPAYGRWDVDPVITSEGAPSFDGGMMTARHRMRPLTPDEMAELARRGGS